MACHIEARCWSVDMVIHELQSMITMFTCRLRCLYLATTRTRSTYIMAVYLTICGVCCSWRHRHGSCCCRWVHTILQCMVLQRRNHPWASVNLLKASARWFLLDGSSPHIRPLAERRLASKSQGSMSGSPMFICVEVDACWGYLCICETVVVYQVRWPVLKGCLNVQLSRVMFDL
jgi:hypothetical protein